MSKNSIYKDSRVICHCPLDGVIDIISKKWALLIKNEIENHNRIRYNGLQKEFGRISLIQILQV
jgi:DNA-binding HxlR family transcriptional regulator